MPLPVSCVMPCRNGARHLAESLASAVAADVAEVIVVDDGSTDGSAAIAEAAGPPVRLLRQPPRGAAAARNAGLALASQEMIAFLDADDLWPAGALTPLLAALAADPALDAAYGHVVQFLSPELAPEDAARLPPLPAPMPGRSFGSILFRRGVFARIGGFDAALRAGEILEFMARFADAGLVARCLPDVVLRRRIHAANSTRRSSGAVQAYPRALKAVLDRRRQAAAP